MSIDDNNNNNNSSSVAVFSNVPMQSTNSSAAFAHAASSARAAAGMAQTMPMAHAAFAAPIAQAGGVSARKRSHADHNNDNNADSNEHGAKRALSGPAPFWLAPTAVLSGRVVRRLNSAATDDTDDAPLTLEAEQLPEGGSRVQCVRKALVWTACVPQRVTHVAGNGLWSALACADGTLMLRSSCGRLLVPAMVMGAPFIAVEASSRRFLLTVLADGRLAVWNVVELRCVLRTDVRALFTLHADGSSDATPFLAGASVGEDDGMPVVTLANSESFVYHAQLETWLRVVDRRHLRAEHTSLLPGVAEAVDNSCAVTTPPGAPAATAGESAHRLHVLARQQADIGRELLLAGAASLRSRAQPFGSSIETAQAASIEHLEHRLTVAMLLGPYAEQERWLIAYARSAHLGLAPRFFELLMQLLGAPPTPHTGSGGDHPRLASFRLVRGALQALRIARTEQRLYAEIKQTFNEYMDAAKLSDMKL